jgi:tetratricopeptide (TPR) repeat protein
LRLSGSLEPARTAAERALELDPIDPWAATEHAKILNLLKMESQNAEDLKRQLFEWDPQLVLETALEYASGGLYSDASELLQNFSLNRNGGFGLASYYDSYFKDRMGKLDEARTGFKAAMVQPVDSVFSFRSEGIDVFKTALKHNPEDGTAHYYLGLVFAKLGDLENAIAHWEQSVVQASGNPRAWRNLGLAFQHNGTNLRRSLECYEKAFELTPTDSRILLELDEVRQELGFDPAERLRFLKQHRSTVESRDDLLKSMLDLMLKAGEYREALDYFNSHHFKLWEGRYDIHNAFIDANVALARSADNPTASLEYYQKACEYPSNLEVAPREPNLRGFLYYPMAKLHQELGNKDDAIRLLRITAAEESDFPTLGSYYQALALRDLGETQRANVIMAKLREVARSLVEEGKAPGYRWETGELQKALGLYYLARLEEAADAKEKAQSYLEEANSLVPGVERQAVMLAQRVYARAHQ